MTDQILIYLVVNFNFCRMLLPWHRVSWIVILCQICYNRSLIMSIATILVLYNAGPLDVSWAVNSAKVAAIIESFFPAQVNTQCCTLSCHLRKDYTFRLVVVLQWMFLLVWSAQLEDFPIPGQPVLIKQLQSLTMVILHIIHYFMYTQVPEITDYTMVNRTYRYFEGVPLFPFGYGLYAQLNFLRFIKTQLFAADHTPLLSTLI